MVSRQSLSYVGSVNQMMSVYIYIHEVTKNNYSLVGIYYIQSCISPHIELVILDTKVSFEFRILEIMKPHFVFHRSLVKQSAVFTMLFVLCEI